MKRIEGSTEDLLDLALDEFVIDSIVDCGRIAAWNLQPGMTVHWYGERTVAETFYTPGGRFVRMVDGSEWYFGDTATFRAVAS